MSSSLPARMPNRFWSFVPLIAALLSGGWLLSTRFLSAYAVDALTGLQMDAFTWLALPVFIWAVVFSLVHLLQVPATARRMAALPLVVCLLVGAVYVAPVPIIDDMLDDTDFQRHYAARTEVVQRIESGELWNGSPFNTLVSLPWPEYPTSVSNSGGWRDVTVYREDGALHVVFHPVKGGFRTGTPVMYRSDGQPPSLPNRVLRSAVSSERLDEHWHRVTLLGTGGGRLRGAAGGERRPDHDHRGGAGAPGAGAASPGPAEPGSSPVSARSTEGAQWMTADRASDKLSTISGYVVPGGARTWKIVTSQWRCSSRRRRP